jgi:hypothetical protein
MTWELYEVWAEDDIGHQELIETTKSLKEARAIAQTTLIDYPTAVIYKETEDGDTTEIERLTYE